MKPHVKRCVARHKPGPGWTVTLRTLTTYDEVVDVIPSGPPSAFCQCLVEGAWKVRLTSAFYEQYDAFDFTLPEN